MPTSTRPNTPTPAPGRPNAIGSPRKARSNPNQSFCNINRKDIKPRLKIKLDKLKEISPSRRRLDVLRCSIYGLRQMNRFETAVRASRAILQRHSLHSLMVSAFCLDMLLLVAGSPLVSLMLEVGAVSPSRDIHADRAILGLSAGLIYGLAALALGVYSARDMLNRRLVLPRMIRALLLTFGGIVLVGAAMKVNQDYSRLWYGIWACVTLLVLPVLRSLQIGAILASIEAGKAVVYQAFSVGFGCDPLAVADISAHRGCAVRVPSSLRLDQLEQLDGLVDAVQRAGNIDHVYIRLPWEVAPGVMDRLGGFRRLSSQVLLVPFHEAFFGHALSATSVADNFALIAQERPLDGWQTWSKRSLDIAFSLLFLALASPVMIVAALLVRWQSPGPIIFKQKRVGLDGCVIEVFKFRSMYVDQSDADASRQTSKGDPRVTSVGRWLRATSIDELPQFFNVLRGDMSVVGPRPHALKTSAEGRLLDDVTSEYAFRHRVKPGITGLAQINGCRGELDTMEKVRRRVAYDLHYADNWSIWLDLQIILRTALVVWRDKAAF